MLLYDDSLTALYISKMEKFPKSIKCLPHFQKKVHDDFNISKKYKSFPQFFQLGPLHKKVLKNDKNTFPCDKLSFINFSPSQNQPF